MKYLQANNFKENPQENILSCFEYEYEKDGVSYMDVYVHVDGVTQVDAYSQFNWELWNFGRAIATEKDAEKDVAVARFFAWDACHT